MFTSGLMALGIITAGLCFLAMAGLCVYLAHKIVKMYQLSQAALAHAMMEAALLLKAQSTIEKAQHDTVQADTDARIKILTDSLEIEREKANQAINDSITLTAGQNAGRVLDMKEWSRL